MLRKGTLDRHSITPSECELISPALVTTGAKAKREWFYMWWPQTVALPFSFLTDSSLVLCSASVLITTGSMRRSLQPNQVA